MGVRESDTGLAPPNLWDVAADAQRSSEKTLQVARCQTIMRASESTDPPTTGLGGKAAPSVSR